jgi:hypothetical protein
LLHDLIACVDFQSNSTNDISFSTTLPYPDGQTRQRPHAKAEPWPADSPSNPNTKRKGGRKTVGGVLPKICSHEHCPRSSPTQRRRIVAAGSLTSHSTAMTDQTKLWREADSAIFAHTGEESVTFCVVLRLMSSPTPSSPSQRTTTPPITRRSPSHGDAATNEAEPRGRKWWRRRAPRLKHICTGGG